MSSLRPDEDRLEGRWLRIDGDVIADEVTQRIEALLATDLEKRATSADGWSVLYVDRRDGRRWELSYPHKEWHGGGPPLLSLVSDAYAQEKYGV